MKRPRCQAAASAAHVEGMSRFRNGPGTRLRIRNVSYAPPPVSRVTFDGCVDSLTRQVGRVSIRLLSIPSATSFLRIELSKFLTDESLVVLFQISDLLQS